MFFLLAVLSVRLDFGLWPIRWLYMQDERDFQNNVKSINIWQHFSTIFRHHLNKRKKQKFFVRYHKRWISSHFDSFKHSLFSSYLFEWKNEHFFLRFCCWKDCFSMESNRSHPSMFATAAGKRMKWKKEWKVYCFVLIL